jgi:hypothetical protein
VISKRREQQLKLPDPTVSGHTRQKQQTSPRALPSI